MYYVVMEQVDEMKVVTKFGVFQTLAGATAFMNTISAREVAWISHSWRIERED